MQSVASARKARGGILTANVCALRYSDGTPYSDGTLYSDGILVSFPAVPIQSPKTPIEVNKLSLERLVTFSRAGVGLSHVSVGLSSRDYERAYATHKSHNIASPVTTCDVQIFINAFH